MTSIKKIWINYCENSSLHGLRYIVHKDAKPLERFDDVFIIYYFQ